MNRDARETADVVSWKRVPISKKSMKWCTHEIITYENKMFMICAECGMHLREGVNHNE